MRGVRRSFGATKALRGGSCFSGLMKLSYAT